MYNTLKRFFASIEMSKRTIKERERNQRKSRWAIIKLQRKNVLKKKRSWNNYARLKGIDNIRNDTEDHKPQYEVVAPEVFSLVNNLEETLSFFSKVFSFSKKCNKGDILFFNLSGVNVITPDAVMYLISIIRNMKRFQGLGIYCKGNVPRNESARIYLAKTGFYNYVRAIGALNDKHDENIVQILSGKNADSVTAAKTCDFVKAKVKPCFIQTRWLYRSIIEMMTNTFQHAYRGFDISNDMSSNWYLYVENQQDSICFVFLDTGAGIPATIRKNYKEKLKSIVKNDDATYIASALKGEFRTSTGQTYRGKGLPALYEDVLSIDNSGLMILSGSGRCIVQNDGTIDETNSKLSLKGTLFSWQLNKKMEEK